MLNVDLTEMHMAETHEAAILATMLARVPLEDSATIHKKTQSPLLEARR